MSKVNFSKTILRTIGIICLLISSMCLYGGISYGIQLSIAGYALAIVLLILSVALDMKKDMVISKAKSLGRAGFVILITILLHSIGIWAMSHVNWIVGVSLFLFGIANLLFLSPATKGFVEEN